MGARGVSDVPGEVWCGERVTYNRVRADTILDVPYPDSRVEPAAVCLLPIRAEGRLRHARSVALQYAQRRFAFWAGRVLLDASPLLAVGSLLCGHLVFLRDGGVPDADEPVPRGREEVRAGGVGRNRGERCRVQVQRRDSPRFCGLGSCWKD